MALLPPPKTKKSHKPNPATEPSAPTIEVEQHASMDHHSSSPKKAQENSGISKMVSKVHAKAEELRAALASVAMPEAMASVEKLSIHRDELGRDTPVSNHLKVYSSLIQIESRLTACKQFVELNAFAMVKTSLTEALHDQPDEVVKGLGNLATVLESLAALQFSKVESKRSQPTAMDISGSSKPARKKASDAKDDQNVRKLMALLNAPNPESLLNGPTDDHTGSSKRAKVMPAPARTSRMATPSLGSHTSREYFMSNPYETDKDK